MLLRLDVWRVDVCSFRSFVSSMGDEDGSSQLQVAFICCDHDEKRVLGAGELESDLWCRGGVEGGCCFWKSVTQVAPPHNAPSHLHMGAEAMDAQGGRDGT